MLLLDALPDELRHETISARAATSESIVFMVHCPYQPDGAGEAGEKAHLLKFLTAPETGTRLGEHAQSSEEVGCCWWQWPSSAGSGLQNSSQTRAAVEQPYLLETCHEWGFSNSNF